jgi:hypothetical protein
VNSSAAGQTELSKIMIYVLLGEQQLTMVIHGMAINDHTWL